MTERTEYYRDYWKEPQFEDCHYVLWKAGITRVHPAVAQASSILDVGCGGGAILRAVRRPGVRLVGTEVSEGAVQAVRDAGLEGVRVDLERERLPFPTGSFDVALCFDVFEHLFSPELLLAEIHRVVQPGGHALLCVPNSLNGFNRLVFAAGAHVDIMDTSHRGEELFSNHIRLFSKALFEKFLRSSPFEITGKHFYFPPEFTDSRYRVPAQVNLLVRKTRLPQVWPSMFALGFLYACRKA